MYSPDSFSPPPMEDMSPTTGNNDSFQLFEERIFPFVVFLHLSSTGFVYLILRSFSLYTWFLSKILSFVRQHPYLTEIPYLHLT